MSSVPKVIIHGARDFPITTPEETPRRQALDSVKQTFQTGTKRTFRPGAAFPGYSSIFIDEATEVEEIPDHAYEVQLKGLGLLDGRDKIASSSTAQPEGGWDTGSQTIYTRKPELYQPKRQHPLIDTLWLGDLEKENEIGDIVRVSASYRGIVPVDTDNLGNPVPKGYKRVISTTAGSQSTSEPVQAYIYVTGTGWVLSSPANYNFDSSRVAVTDSYLSTTPPDFNRLPGNWQPPGVPNTLESQGGIYELAPSGVAISASVLAQAYINKPWGWVLRTYNCEQLYDLPVYLYSLTAEWVPRITLKV